MNTLKLVLVVGFNIIMSVKFVIFLVLQEATKKFAKWLLMGWINSCLVTVKSLKNLKTQIISLFNCKNFLTSKQGSYFFNICCIVINWHLSHFDICKLEACVPGLVFGYQIFSPEKAGNSRSRAISRPFRNFPSGTE